MILIQTNVFWCCLSCN